jgi:hypothetical protein
MATLYWRRLCQQVRNMSTKRDTRPERRDVISTCHPVEAIRMLKSSEIPLVPWDKGKKAPINSAERPELAIGPWLSTETEES